MKLNRLSPIYKYIFVEVGAHILLEQLKREKAASAQARHERLIDRAAKTERKFKAALKRYFNKQRDALLEGLAPRVFMDMGTPEQKAYTAKACKDLLELYQNDREAWREELETLAGIHVTDAVKQTGEAELKEFAAGVSFKVTNPRVERKIAERTNKLSFSVNNETMRKLRDTLAEGSALGEGIPDIRRRVQGVFDDMSKYRAERIARTETIWGANAGAEEAWIQSGVVEGKEWHAAGDACAFCLDMHGATMGLGQAFFEHGGRLVVEDAGTMVFDYEEVQHPPLHPHGRCCLLPIVKEVAVQKTAEEVRQEIVEIEKGARSEAGRHYDESQRLMRRSLEAKRQANLNLADKLRAQAKVANDKRNEILDGLAQRCREKLYVSEKGIKLDANMARGMTAKHQKVCKDGIHEFTKFIDPDLLEYSDKYVKAFQMEKGGRAFSRGTAIHIAPENEIKTVVHEMGHWLEHESSSVRMEARAFLQRRTKGESGKWLGDHYAKTELTKKDKFLHPYMGKQYGVGGVTEITSMGMQYMYEAPYTLAADDPEYFRFIYDLVRGNLWK